jgi:hypothetical protein
VHRFVALALSLAIPVAALAAPLVHVHPDEHATAHHGGATVHAHWAGHGDAPGAGDGHGQGHGDDAGRGPGRVASGSPFVDGVDRDRALFFSAFIAVTPSAMPTPGVVPAAVALPVPVERPAHLSLAVTHGHDPPVSRLLPARAPPSFLS